MELFWNLESFEANGAELALENVASLEAMGPTTVKGVLDDQLGYLKFDKTLADAIHQYQVDFVNKNEEHVTFFGGHLTGVQVVRFTTTDSNNWFSGILETDEDILKPLLQNLPGIDKTHVVSSDTYNLTCLWLIHRFNKSSLPKDLKERAKRDVCLILNYKFLTSLLAHYFKYPADPAIAEATYNALSYKFLLKQKGSWLAVLETRATDILSPTGIHAAAIRDMNRDDKVVYFLNNTQGAIRDMLKNIYRVFIETHSSGTRISNSSSTVVFEGQERVKDITDGEARYRSYINSIITDKASFIRPEILEVVEDLMRSADPRLTKTTLEYMSDNAISKKTQTIERVLNTSVIHAVEYLQNSKNDIATKMSLTEIICKLRGAYTASKTSEPLVLQLREDVERLVRDATKYKNQTMVAAVRTAVLLYIILRAFVMDKL